MPRRQIALTQPDISDLEHSYVKKALTDGRLAAGESFSVGCSSEIAERLQCADVLLTSSCTDALELSALLLDIGPGDVVVIPSFTFSSVATAFIRTGAAVRFVDIERATLGIDPTSLRLAMDEDVKAVIPVHYAGVPFDLPGVNKVLADWPGAALVEDNAHGLFGRFDGRFLGTFGRLGVTSFHATKNLVSGEGGALIINDPSLADRAQVLAEKGTDRHAFLLGQVDKYTWRDTGSSFGLAEPNAALLAGQLERSEEINGIRSARYQEYLNYLRNAASEGQFALPNDRAGATPVRHLFHVLLQSEEIRDSVLIDLVADGIGAAFHYVPLHSAPAALKYGRGSGPCPVSEDVSRRLLRLPLHSGLTTSDVEYVADRFLASVQRHV